MTEIELSGLEESLDRLIRDDFKKERRMMLNGKSAVRMEPCRKAGL